VNFTYHWEINEDKVRVRVASCNYAQDFNLDVDLDLIDMDDVAPPPVKLGDANCHASLLSNFLLESCLYFGANLIINFQKSVGILDKITIARLGRQHHGFLDSYYKNS
jgi:hypothetical protein